jgi:mono/diheme cytochrome c family protein
MSRSAPRLPLLLAVALVLSTPALAAGEDDGRRIAERWCASCHIVSSSQTKAQDGVPSFARIGASQGFDEKSLTAFLASPHPRMPDMALSRPELAALVAWIKAEGKR